MRQQPGFGTLFDHPCFSAPSSTSPALRRTVWSEVWKIFAYTSDGRELYLLSLNYHTLGSPSRTRVSGPGYQKSQEKTALSSATLNSVRTEPLG